MTGDTVMRNAAAHAALKRFCQESLEYLGKAVGGLGELPRHRGIASLEVTETGYHATYDWEVDWGEVLGEHLGDTESIAAWSEALSELEADDRLRGRAVTTEQPRLTARGVLYRLVSEQGGLEFQDAAFERVYRETEDYFYRDTVRYRYLAPLGRFRMEPAQVKLGPELSIVRISDGWSREMLMESMGGSPVAAEVAQLVSKRYGLVLYSELQKEKDVEGFYRRPREEEGAIKNVRDTFREVCSALRVFKNGAVGYEQIIPRPTSWVPARTMEIWGGGAQSVTGAPYVLSEQETAEFETFWDEHWVRRVGMEKNVALAVRRFNMAYGRGWPEERLLDLMIGFEALLLENEQELRYKLAMRGAALLGKDGDERETIRGELGAAYKQRNHIVHGGRADEELKIGDEEGVSLTNLNSRVEERLRAAIRKIMDMEPSVSKPALVDRLDRRIARGFGQEPRA